MNGSWGWLCVLASVLPAMAAPTVAGLAVAAVTPAPAVGFFGLEDGLGAKVELERRKDVPDTSHVSAATVTMVGANHKTTVVTLAVTDTASVHATTPTSAPRALPLPFDTSSAYEFPNGSPCPDFLNAMLVDPTFVSCYPFSLLIQTSSGLFDASRQLTTLVNVLDASCAADSSVCAPWMDDTADSLLQTCAVEFAAAHPMVRQAYEGLRAYSVVYSATCLQNPTADSSYCYASALTNLTSPDDAYLYFLPYNLTLPEKANPSCGWCTHTTMDIFRAASADRDLLIAETYEGAAAQINDFCGEGFVDQDLPEAQEGVGAALLPASLWAVLSVGLLVAL